jgi:hypothetical protein
MLWFNGNSPATVYNNRQPFIVPNSVKLVSGNYVENDIPVGGSAAYSYFNESTNAVMSENFVLDKTFLKLRELTLSYSIPGKVLGKTPIKGLELGLVGRNLLMWTPASNTLVDPEASNMGNDLISDLGEFAAGPTSRYFGGSIKVSF